MTMTPAEVDTDACQSAIYVEGNDNTFIRSSIEYSAASGLYVIGSGNRIENCLVTNCDYPGNYQVGAGVGGRDRGSNTVTRCTMFNFGRSALTFTASSRNFMDSPQYFTYNNLYNCMFMADDGGIFYTVGDGGGGTEFAYNWFHDMVRRYNGHHLYFDMGGGYHFLIHHNVFWQERGDSPNNAITTLPMRNCTYNNTSISVDPWKPYGSYLAYDDDERGVNALWADGDPEGWGLKPKPPRQRSKPLMLAIVTSYSRSKWTSIPIEQQLDGAQTFLRKLLSRI